MSHFLVERRSPMADTPHVDEQIDKLVQRHCVNSRQRQAGADEQFDRVRAILGIYCTSIASILLIIRMIDAVLNE